MTTPPIQKKIIHAGTANVSQFPPGTKVLFNFIELNKTFFTILSFKLR